MKAAFTIWNGRIAPVFDVAGQIVITQSCAANDVLQWVDLPEGTATEKLLFLHQQQVEILVCGAMTRSTLLIAEAFNIDVLPFIAGAQQQVIDCWRNNQPFEPYFVMPGCKGCCRQRGQRYGHDRQGRGRHNDQP